LPGFAQEKYKMVQYPDLQAETTVFDILMKGNGAVYLGTDEGLLYINSFEEEPKYIIKDRLITALCDGENIPSFLEVEICLGVQLISN